MKPSLPVKPDPYAALRYRDFRLLIAGRLVAQIGEMMVSVAVGWELYERTNNALALGLVGLAQIIPVMLFSLPGGYIVDRYNRRWVALFSQMMLMACSLALLAISLTDGPLWVLYGVLTLIGAARAFNNPAESALTPQTVPPDMYYNAATWSSSVWQLSAIIGPALGGLLIALTNNPGAVYGLNVLAGGVLVAALLLLRGKYKAAASLGEPPLESLKGGLRFLRDTPTILGAISLDMFAVLFGGATFLLPVFAKDILMVDSTGLGIMRAAPSVGALLMAYIIQRRPPFRRAGAAMLWAVAGFGLVTIGFGLSQSFWLSVVLLALTGALDNISVVVRHTLILTHTPDAMRGRVSSVNSLFIGASNELGGFQSGVAATLLGTVGAVVFGGVMSIVIVGAVAALVPPLRHLGEIKSQEELV